METNETLHIALLREAEQELLQMIEHGKMIPEGDLHTLEQRVLRACFSLGRTLMEQIFNQTAEEAASPCRREGACGHAHYLVGRRPTQLHTLMGNVTMWRSSSQCVVEKEQPSTVCSHGHVPWDAMWEPIAGRTSPGVQKLWGKLVSRLTLAEAVDPFMDLFPLLMSERHALTLTQPRGEALQEQEDEQVQACVEHAVSSKAHPSEHNAVLGTPIRRVSLETDGVMTRIRRGSVLMEEADARRRGDVSREINVGAVGEGVPGRERSDVVPGVFLDEPGPLREVARRLNADACGPVLDALAHRCGVDRAQEVAIVGDGARWIRSLVEEHVPTAVQSGDLSHAREHRWHVATAADGSGTPQGTAWATQADARLVHGTSEELVQMIETLPAIPAFSGASRSIPESEAESFLSHAQRMRSPLFRTQGMHIGRGSAEAACTTVVSTCAKTSGMRWTPDGFDAVLALRTSVLNQSSDSFCDPPQPLLAA